ncbi:MAG: AraC family transcriptional regulator [Verrucomicrobia bacterium]|nr:AraC family transcriptional regulator [Verrucomicrobiota bacterium]
MGIDLAQEPYNRVRLRPEGSFILACLEGEGRMFLEGRWQRVASGDLCLAPPRVLNALHAMPGKKWIFAWLRYDEPPFVKPLVGADSPLRLRDDSEQIGHAIRGLRLEWERAGDRDAALCHHYISLIQRLAQRAAGPWRTTSRVNDIWEFVASHLAETWTLPLLAQRCHMSPEHLRRLCLQELGRTPMDHMAYMRMLRAKNLLETTNDKVEAIASSVGYRSGTVFSRAFLRYVGVLPTQYRDQR